MLTYKQDLRNKIQPFPTDIKPKGLPTTAQKRAIQARIDSRASDEHNSSILTFSHDLHAKMRHCVALATLANKIADVHNIEGVIDATEIYKLLDSMNWRCVETGTTHSDYTPLTIEPIFSPYSRLYRHSIANYRVVYRVENRHFYTIRRSMSRELLELIEDEQDQDSNELELIA